MDDLIAARIRANPKFAELQSKRNTFAWSLAAIIFLVYYGFIALVAFDPALMATPVSGVITLGFFLGLGVILVAIILTGVYVQRANGEFDRLTREIVAGDVSAYRDTPAAAVGAAR